MRDILFNEATARGMVAAEPEAAPAQGRGSDSFLGVLMDMGEDMSANARDIASGGRDGGGEVAVEEVSMRDVIKGHMDDRTLNQDQRDALAGNDLAKFETLSTPYSWDKDDDRGR